ncbi:MAG: DUF4276 family protein [Planctomycetota bacterium]|jgi:hypothetical protein
MSDCLGIIVDGRGDFASLRRRFERGYRILKTDGPRGHTALADAIAKKSRKQVCMLAAFNCNHVVVLTDFEARSQAYEDFVAELRDSFQRVDFPTAVSVVVANRMIENWYLADIEYLSTQKAFLKDGIRQRRFEGTHGKNEIKRFMRQGDSYSETKHGPQMFEILRFDPARRLSASFDDFLNHVQND